MLCDDLGRRISTQYAPYETLYAEFLNLAAPDVLETSVFRAHIGDLPDDVTSFDAVVIGGSRASVYEPHDWIPPLLSVVRSSLESDMSTWGICFGHQVVAAAMGADVGPSTTGWNLAAQNYEILSGPYADSTDPLRLLAFHQDQVHTVPPGTQCYLTSPGCAIAGLSGDNVFTMQPHPEFTPQVIAAILAASRGGPISDRDIDDALLRIDGSFSSHRASELFWRSHSGTA